MACCSAVTFAGVRLASSASARFLSSGVPIHARTALYVDTLAVSILIYEIASVGHCVSFSCR
jgi:hypothetical protein